MKWNYICPECGAWRSCDWEDRINSKECHQTKKVYYPPTPDKQPGAYVDTHEWPQEMETAVISLKGNKCVGPNCGVNYQTLDHKVAFANGGKTSVVNLQPMCEKCNLSKGDKDYITWRIEQSLFY